MPELTTRTLALIELHRNHLPHSKILAMLPPMENKAKPATPPEPRREEAIFDAALALQPEQRLAYLDQACGEDTQLRGHIELLLRSHEHAGKFLEPTLPPGAARTMVVTLPPSEKPGDIIGHYKIREKLGEGGCGVVYVAEQTEPVRRRVALKVIKLGMDTRNVIGRFEAERQALAMMDHPNIARVLDAGATETGRPYFVMELVRGIKITDYCDQSHLSTRQRLELFTQVCHAVQHAHQKGIIHRDIKPSNILVTLHDGVPVPKVIDFGIAKATEGRLTDLTVYTELRQFIGTPAYMSPEQAEMSGLDIDTRSDIYSLGVLLYELLTGRTPFDAEELIQSGLDEMRRTIREKEPSRPSTRLSTMLDADLTAVAQRQSAEPPKLVHFIRGDLDWIVMKALEKDRTRRFESASGLALDVQRFLKNEPIEARPPSSLYRFQKLVRRNKAVFAGAAGVVAALVLGLGLSLYLFVQERHALKRAVAAERRQAELREQAEKGLALEKHALEMVPITAKFKEAGELMGQGLFDKAEDVMSDVPLTIPQSSIIYNTLGEVYGRSSEWPAAIRNFTRSTTADPTNHLAYHYLAPLLVQAGDLGAYQKHRERILSQFGGTTNPAIAEQMAKDCLMIPPPKASLEQLSKMADASVAAGSGDKLWPYFAFVKGLAEYRLGHFDSALEWLKKVTDHERVPARAAQTYATMAMAEYGLGNTNAAREMLTEGIKIAETKLTRGRIDWNDTIIARILLREANGMITGRPAPDGK
jgi:serine/threonine protein kinase/tetratricopeptide (TPR) repeat protein